MSKEQRLSRRSFLKGLGIGSAGMLLAACTPVTQPAAPPAAPQAAAATSAPAAAPTATQPPPPQGFTTQGSKGTINVVYWADTNGFFKKVCDSFTQETGIGVNYEVAPAAYLEWQQFMTTRLASGDTSVDVFHGDDFQSAIYGAAGWLAELDSVVKANNIDIADWPPTLVKDVSAWKGVLYRLPWGNDTEIWFYRTDWFKEAGLEPPKTWDDLLAAAQKLTKGTERYGIALAGHKGGELGNEIQHWTNQAGAAVNKLNNAGAKQALQFYKDLFAKYKVAQPSAAQDDYTAVLNGYLDNKYGMWWCWDGFLGSFRQNKDFWKDQVSSFVPPKGPVNNQTITGCWGWSMSNYSTKKDLGTQWITYTAKPEVMKQQIYRGRVPARMSLWTDKEVQDQAPSAVFLAEMAKDPASFKARPVTPSIQEIYDAAEEQISAYLTDQTDLDTAVTKAMEKIQPILDRDMGA